MRTIQGLLGGTSAVLLVLAVGCSDGATTLGSGSGASSSGSGGSGTGTGGDATTGSGGDTASSSSSSTASTTTQSSATGQGGSDFMPFPAPEVALQDVNANSSSFGNDVSAITFANQVSGWFFGHST